MSRDVFAVFADRPGIPVRHVSLSLSLRPSHCGSGVGIALINVAFLRPVRAYAVSVPQMIIRLCNVKQPGAVCWFGKPKQRAQMVEAQAAIIIYFYVELFIVEDIFNCGSQTEV